MGLCRSCFQNCKATHCTINPPLHLQEEWQPTPLGGRGKWGGLNSQHYRIVCGPERGHANRDWHGVWLSILPPFRSYKIDAIPTYSHTKTPLEWEQTSVNKVNLCLHLTSFWYKSPDPSNHPGGVLRCFISHTTVDMKVT